MARLSEQEISAIRNKADIVDIIGKYVPLTRKGRNYWCTCPFHDDHSPSMSITQDKQIYKCFVCGAGGNVFTFVQNYEKISFIEAVYKVAEYVGMTLSQSIEVKGQDKDPHIAALHKACKETIEFTHYILDSVDAKNVKEYLYQRGITNEIIKKFEIGYHPKENALYRFLHAKKIPDEDILNAGLARMQSSGIKDIFSDRIMIPIHDMYGNPVGFTARRVHEEDNPKYINTAETDVYKKGDLVFNYHRVRANARNQKCIYLVEGAMDVLAFEKVGITNAVATLGTAVTKQQIRLLKQLQVPVFVSFDGDEAGKNATYKFGLLAMKENLEFEIVQNPYDLDPDEIIANYGKDSLISIAQQTESWVNFLLTYLVTKYNLESYSQRKEFAKEVAQAIEMSPDHFEKESYYVRLKEISGFDMRLAQLSRPTEKKSLKPDMVVQQVVPELPKTGCKRAEYEVLTQMLIGVSACNYYMEELGFMRDDIGNKLAIYIIDYYRTHEKMEIAELLDCIIEEPVKALLLDIAQWELSKERINMVVLKDAVHLLKMTIIKDQLKEIDEKIKKVTTNEELFRLLDERTRLSQKLIR